ncbi:MAG: TolC family protein [Geobacter sp.]|nr:MAG: TolC family protein [Geobacter sp.]
MKQFLLVVFSLTLMCGIAGADEQSYPLGLKEALRLAVERNLDLQAQLYTPAMNEADVRFNRGIYDPLLTLSTGYTDTSTLPVSTLTSGGIDKFHQQTFTVDPGINQLFSTGATAGLTFTNSYSTSNAQSLYTRNSYWQSGLALNVNQPLLKNFGRDATEIGIAVALGTKKGSVYHYEGQLLALVLQVKTEYYKLFYDYEDLESKQVSLKDAQRILSDTNARVKAGVLPAMEILNAEFGVASREKDLNDAERAVQDESDILRLLLQLEGKDVIRPVDKPASDRLNVNEEDAIRTSLASRPELKEMQTGIETSEIQSRVAGNNTLPNLNLAASVGLNGLGSGYSRDMERLSSGDYPAWSISLQFDYPLGNTAAKNAYIKSKLKVSQGKVQLRGQQEAVANEVRAAIRALTSSYKQIEVTDRARSYAEENLRAYIRRNEVGLATIKDVLDVENALAAARSNHNRALVDYSIAMNQYWKATGELLDREGIVVSEKDANGLYDRTR